MVTRRIVAAALATLVVAAGGPATVLAWHAYDGRAAEQPGLATPTTSTTQPLVLVFPTTTTRPSTMTTTTTTSSTTTAPPTGDATTTTATTPASTTVPSIVTAPPLVVAAPPTTSPSLAAATTVPLEGDPADVPIGEIDTSGAIPEGLDLTAIPGAPQAGPTNPGGPVFTAGLTCAIQCIASGVAYPRGYGAELVVATHVPARLTLIVVGDTDTDGDYEYTEFTSSGAMVTEFSWALDHLDPGQTYYVTVAATDENDDTSHAFGQFTTLSERTVRVAVGDVAVTGGPTNIVHTVVYLNVDEEGFSVVEPESTGAFVHTGLDRIVDLMLQVRQTWETSQSTICESSTPSVGSPQGDSDDYCLTWNSAVLDNLDVDVIPAGRSRWTETSFQREFSTPTGEGDALPPGYGDPRYFNFSAPVVFTVTYS